MTNDALEDRTATVFNPFSRLSPECQQKVDSGSVEVVSDFVWNNQGVFDTNPIIDSLQVLKCFRPKDPYQISKAIIIAEADHKCIRAVGSGWSYSDAPIPQAPAAGAFAPPGELGYIIDSSAFSSCLDSQLDQIAAADVNRSQFVFVEAGMTLDALNQKLDNDNPSRALPTMGGSSGQSIGGLPAVLSRGTPSQSPLAVLEQQLCRATPSSPYPAN